MDTVASTSTGGMVRPVSASAMARWIKDEEASSQRQQKGAERSLQWEWEERNVRVIGGGEGTHGSKEGGRSEQDKEGRGKRLPWTQIVRGRTATPPTGR